MTKPKVPTPAQAYKARKLRGWKAWDIHRWFGNMNYGGSKRSRQVSWLRKIWNVITKPFQERAEEKRKLTNLRKAREELGRANQYKLTNLKAIDKSISLIQRRKGER